MTLKRLKRKRQPLTKQKTDGQKSCFHFLALCTVLSKPLNKFSKRHALFLLSISKLNLYSCETYSGTDVASLSTTLELDKKRFMINLSTLQ